jgi:integrase
MKLQSDRYTTGEKALTREEYDTLVKVITDLQDELMIRLGVATGIRREDLCNIECDNIHLKDKTMLFYESKKSRNKTVDLPDEIISLIHQFYNTLDKSERKKRKILVRLYLQDCVPAF